MKERFAEEGATRASDYLKATFQDVAQIENEKDGDAQNVLITFSGNMAEIMENINAFAGGSYNTVRYLPKVQIFIRRTSPLITV